MYSKQQIRLFTWIAGIVVVAFDLAVVAWSMERPESAACTATSPVSSVQLQAPTAVLFAPALLLLTDNPERG
ncbi:MAG: hypothetical protein AAF350_00165 [Pseudomonadota bacterium]